MRTTGYSGITSAYLNSGYQLGALSRALGRNQGASYGGVGSTGSFSAILAQKQSAIQNATKNAAQSLRDSAQALSETGADSLFAKAERSGNRRGLEWEIGSFVTGYNAMCQGMEQAGGTVNKVYLGQLKNYAAQHQEELEKAGIQVASGGKLSVDEKRLGNADMDALKKVFTGAGSFAGKAAVKSIYAEAGAMSATSYYSAGNALLSGSLGGYYPYSNYGNYNNYSNYGNYNSSRLLMNSFLNTLI